MASVHTGKKGLRALGIAESFRGRSHSLLAGVVMRMDLVVDGIAFGEATVGGMDATRAVIEIYRSLHRRDINFMMLSGCVIAWYNIIDPVEVVSHCGLPVIVVTYEESEGLEEDIRCHFPGDKERLQAYRRLGTRRRVRLNTGHELFVRSWGVEEGVADALCRKFTLVGKIPEPLRLARLIARAALELKPAGMKEKSKDIMASNQRDDPPRDECDRDRREQHPEHSPQNTDHDIAA